jgi:hypothetical protein
VTDGVTLTWDDDLDYTTVIGTDASTNQATLTVQSDDATLTLSSIYSALGGAVGNLVVLDVVIG